MPNAWTHIIFGQLVLSKLGENRMIAAAEQKIIFNMGSQGPDFLLFNRFYPWQKNSALKELGNVMHNKNCGLAIMEMLDGVKGRSADPDTADQSLLYAVAFVIHHVLDRHMHPFVYSRSGFLKWDHQRYEIMMDTILARKLANFETISTPVWREITGELPEPIIAIYERIARNYYEELALNIQRKDWILSFRYMLRAHKLFHDPTGLKRLFTFGLLEPFLYHRKVNYDVWNECMLPWIDPTDNQIVHHESGWMLWERALGDAVTITRTVLQWLRCPDEEELPELRNAALSLIGNYSYESGLPCDSGLPIRYSEPIWLQ
ncbi:hypothetical protein [Paenibacillus sp. NEAU-GSW1]|uniref:hypothetical protein n=1 Tax=Paenibacillus sp. NEAU-GSW1 TaxID=2682486 RepID=UPI0012E31E10|nr:hypothetical protein [Paenibacillus sp. NEAU-GSW1]MUT65882.1 hypothetical protein [Paenibacillus sp. NEAU-GSW1]